MSSIVGYNYMLGYLNAIQSKFKYYYTLFFIICVMFSFLYMVQPMLVRFMFLPATAFFFSLLEDINMCKFLKKQMNNLKSDK
jgi:hypothetical protein